MIVSRFAPAPTGFLHLGHVLNAIYVWGVTRALGGLVLLRIEDHDRQRSRPQFERAILEDLDWLGFCPDSVARPFEGGETQPVARPSEDRETQPVARPSEDRETQPVARPTEGHETQRVARPFQGRETKTEAVTRQSDRQALYESALDRLRSNGLVYACQCSRSEIAAAGETGSEIRYPGTCAGKGLAESAGRGTRVRLEPSVERFEDRRQGLQEQRPAEQCGDLLVRDRDGNWTYQFAVTVDDLDQGVTLVIRGDDLLESTGRQIQLARLLGRDEPPAFLHHGLIMKTATQKLSKSDGDTGIGDLRAKGWTAPRVIGHAAALAALIDSPRELEASTVSDLFRA